MGSDNLYQYLKKTFLINIFPGNVHNEKVIFQKMQIIVQKLNFKQYNNILVALFHELSHELLCI